MHNKLEHMKETLMCAVEMELCNLGEVDTEELGAAIDMIKDLEEAIYYCTVTEAMKGGGDSEIEMEMKKSDHHKQSKETEDEGRMYGGSRYYPMMYENGEDMMYARRRRADGTFYADGGRGGSSYARNGGGGSSYADGNGGSSYVDGGQSGSSYANGGQQGGGGQTGSSGGSSSYADGGSSYNSMYGGPMYAERDEREGRSYNSRRMYMEAKDMKRDKATQLRELEKYMQELSQDVTDMIADASLEEKQYLEKKITALASKIGQMK